MRTRLKGLAALVAVIGIDRVGGLLLAMLLSATSTSAIASFVVVEFGPDSVELIGPEDPRNSISIYQQFKLEGFRFSPQCHVHLVDLTAFEISPPTPSAVLSADGSGCGGDSLSNADYLGAMADTNPGGADVYIDFFDVPFSLESLVYGTPYGGYVMSSKGGRVDLPISANRFQPPFWETITFSGPDWEGIKWIIVGGGDAGGPTWWVDDLTFRIPTGLPTPGTLALVGIAMLGVAASNTASTRINAATRASRRRGRLWRILASSPSS